jgi:glycerol-3-phosphate dehydrogenase (NAD(P)+)
MVAEGVRTTVSVYQLARRQEIEMPITAAIHAILFEGMAPLDAVSALMNRSAKTEDWLPEVLM